MPAVATLIRQSSRESPIFRKGTRDPLTHACTDLKSSNEMTVLSQLMMIIIINYYYYYLTREPNSPQQFSVGPSLTSIINYY